MITGKRYRIADFIRFINKMNLLHVNDLNYFL